MDSEKTQQPTIISTVASDPLIGSTIGERFRIIAKVDSGGLSDVYKAMEISSVRPVALKIIRITREPGRAGFEMFGSNAHPSVQHPNLITMHACGLTDAGEPWLAMEWLEGKTLQHLLDRDGTLPLEMMLHIFDQVADALGYVHSKGDVHINLKPSNIIVMEREGKPFVKISDFGFAKMLIEREMEMADEKAPARGSTLYMSPEQFKGTQIDSRTDVYALGCILYQSLIGRPPHQGLDMLETMDRHINVDVQFPSEPDLSEPLQAVIRKMLAKSPIERQRTLRDAMQELRAAMQGEMPKMETPLIETAQERGLDFLSAKRGTARPKGNEPWMLLTACVTLLLFVLIFQQCMMIVQESAQRYEARRR